MLTLDQAYDDIEEIESAGGARMLETLRDRADALAPGQPGRAAYLNVLGEHLLIAGEHDAARHVFEEARADGGETMLHPETNLLWVDLVRGDEAAVESRLRDLLALARAGSLGAASCSHVGGLLAEHDRPRQALRWFTIPLRDLEPEEADGVDEACITGRARVRDRLGLPPDRWDEVAEEIRAAYAAE